MMRIGKPCPICRSPGQRHFANDRFGDNLQALSVGSRLTCRSVIILSSMCRSLIILSLNTLRSELTRPNRAPIWSVTKGDAPVETEFGNLDGTPARRRRASRKGKVSGTPVA